MKKSAKIFVSGIIALTTFAACGVAQETSAVPTKSPKVTAALQETQIIEPMATPTDIPTATPEPTPTPSPEPTATPTPTPDGNTARA